MNLSITYNFCTKSKPRATGDNEDLGGYCGNYYWLMDGASTWGQFACPTPGLTSRWLVEQVDALLQSLCSKNPDIALDALLAKVEAAVHQKLVEKVGSEITPKIKKLLPQCTLVLIRLGKDYVDYALIQDSSLLIKDGNSGEVEVIKDNRQDEFNAQYYDEIKSCLKSKKPIDDILNAMVKRERAEKNKKTSFITFDASGSVSSKAIYGRKQFALNSKSEIWLVSDGAARAWEVFGMSLEQATATSPSELIAWVREQEKADPNSFKYPRVSPQDDATVVKLSWYDCSPQKVYIPWGRTFSPVEEEDKPETLARESIGDFDKDLPAQL